jgi:hypothetical protein
MAHPHWYAGGHGDAGGRDVFGTFVTALHEIELLASQQHDDLFTQASSCHRPQTAQESPP